MIEYEDVNGIAVPKYYEFYKGKRMKPVSAEGKICIDLTDPITGKVKERINAKNHVFPNALFFGWYSNLNSIWTCLNTSVDDIDVNVPYLLGQTVGYGIPSTQTSGTIRGAYNAANQVLGAMSLSSARWKYQYDFTTAQANGTAIGCIGITNQYSTSNEYNHISGFSSVSRTSGYATSDGRYTYVCSTAGIITVTDCWQNTSSNIDVSSVVGTVSNSYKHVGVSKDTGRYYIMVQSSTSSNRKMYVFSDGTFGTLLNTYSPTNMTITNNQGYPCYVYGNKAYMFSSDLNIIYIINFVNNVFSSINVTAYNNAAYNEYTSTANGWFYYGTMPIGSKFMIGTSDTSSSNRKGVIFDMSTETVVGFVSGHTASNSYALCRHPLLEGGEVVACKANGGFTASPCVAAYKLPTPVTKTSANAMTATYEIEVFWDAA